MPLIIHQQITASQCNVSRLWYNGIFNKSSAAAEMGNHLATTDMGQKVGGGCYAPFCGGRWVPIFINVAWAEAILRTKWHLDPSNHLATIRMTTLFQQ